MPLEIVLALVMLGALVLYALSGGADFGGGMWDFLAAGPEARAQQQTVEDAIAPIWEANHVWLILVVVVLFSAFPPAFAAIMVALHIPLTAALIGIVFRGSAFAFRKYDVADHGAHRRWSAVFGAASLATPFFLGLSLGAIASGRIRVEGGQVVTGFFAGWTGAFAVACGLFAQALFAYLAAVYLTIDAGDRPRVQEAFRRRALASGVVLVPVAAMVFLLAHRGAPEIYQGLTSRWALPLLLAAGASAATALLGLHARRFQQARAAAVAQVALILLGWGFAQYPYVVVPDLTFAETRTAHSTLRLLTWALAAGAVVLFPSFVYLFRVFRQQTAPHRQH